MSVMLLEFLWGDPCGYQDNICPLLRWMLLKLYSPSL